MADCKNRDNRGRGGCSPTRKTGRGKQWLEARKEYLEYMLEKMNLELVNLKMELASRKQVDDNE